MHPPRRPFVLAVIALGGAVLSAHVTRADEQPPPRAADEITVTAKALGELRLRIENSKDAIFARFNDINSDDRFDIHCYTQATTGTRIEHRECVSNSWREEDEKFGQAWLAQLRGEYGANPQQYKARQLLMQQHLVTEMERLVDEDPQLHEEMVRLGQAYAALEAITGSHAVHTLERELLGGDAGLPYDARRIVQVRVGIYPWVERLKEHTFTLASVTGRIRKMEVECEHGRMRLEFRDESEWTLPSRWGACTLTVSAKRETTFAFVEFN